MAAGGWEPSAPHLLPELFHFCAFSEKHRGAQWLEAPLPAEGVLTPRLFSRIKLKSLEKVCVDPTAPWVKKLLQDLPHL